MPPTCKAARRNRQESGSEPLYPLEPRDAQSDESTLASVCLRRLFRAYSEWIYRDSLSCCAVVATLAGCAAPGEPIERKPPVAQPISDLMAQQTGNGVSLTFTVPQETTDRRPLPQAVAIEIFRDSLPRPRQIPKLHLNAACHHPSRHDIHLCGARPFSLH